MVKIKKGIDLQYIEKLPVIGSVGQLSWALVDGKTGEILMSMKSWGDEINEAIVLSSHFEWKMKTINGMKCLVPYHKKNKTTERSKNNPR